MRFLKTQALAVLVATVGIGAGAGRLALHAQSTGATGKLVIHINTNAVGFGPIGVGQASPPKTITLENVGDAPMSINDAVVTGVNASDFSLTSTCGSLAPGALCTMSFAFTPSAQGPRSAMLHITASTPTAPYMLPLVGNGIDPTVAQPAAGPIDPRTGYPTYFSDGFNTLELCLDATPPNDAAGNPLPQTIGPEGLLTPTMCLTPVPDPTRPPATTDSPETSNMFDEHFWWSTGAEATPAGWTRAIIVMAQEAAFTAEPFAGNQSAFGRLRLRADGVPPGTYRFTHPFGADTVTVAEGDDRIFETSDIGCFAAPCDYNTAVPGLTRIARFLQCTNAPIVVNGVEYLGDPNVECTITGSPVNQNFFRVERVEANGSRTLLAQTTLFAVTGKRVASIAAPPPTNQAPDAVNDSVSTPFNTAVTIAVLANDTDPNAGDSLHVTNIGQGTGGTAVLNAGGTITYTPGSTFSGVDSLVYGIADAAGLADSATVTITVGAAPPVNNAPVAANDSGVTNFNTAATIAVLANDSDPDGDVLHVSGLTNVVNGSAVLNAAATAVVFTPAANFSGLASFSYGITDGRGGSATASVTITVNPPATSPTGLVLAMNFDEASGTSVLDHSGLATPNNGTMNAGVVRVGGRSAAAGSALQFNGTSGMVSIPDAASLDLTSAVTISAWVRWSGGADWQSLILKERGTAANPGLSYSLYASDPTRNRPAGFFRLLGVDQSIASTTALPLNTWVHIAVTYGGGFMRFYVNGVQVSQVAQSGNLTASANPLRIGGNAIWGEFFAGQVDDVRIYNRVLTAADIVADMSNPVQ